MNSLSRLVIILLGTLILMSSSCCREAVLLNNSEENIIISFKTYIIDKGRLTKGDTSLIFSEISIYDYKNDTFDSNKTLKIDKEILTLLLEPNQALGFGSICRFNEDIWRDNLTEQELTIITQGNKNIDLREDFNRFNKDHKQFDILPIQKEMN